MSPRLSSPIPARSTLLGLAPLPLLLSSRSRLSSPRQPITHERIAGSASRAGVDAAGLARTASARRMSGRARSTPEIARPARTLSRSVFPYHGNQPRSFPCGARAHTRLYLPVRASRPWRLQLHAGVVDVTRVCLLLKPPWASRRNESRHCPRTPCDREREVCGPPLTPNADIPPSLAVTGMIDTTHDRFVGADTLSRPRTHLTARAASP